MSGTTPGRIFGNLSVYLPQGKAVTDLSVCFELTEQKKKTHVIQRIAYTTCSVITKYPIHFVLHYPAGDVIKQNSYSLIVTVMDKNHRPQVKMTVPVKMPGDSLPLYLVIHIPHKPVE